MQSESPVLLLVEDNTMLRSTLRRYLDQRLPAKVVEAASAMEALDLAARYRPDVVLLDLSLPDASGAAVIGQLRSVIPGARLIAMASHLERLHSDEATRAGAWASIPKEALGSQLEALVWRALPSSNLNLSARLTQWRVVARTGYPGQFARWLTESLVWASQEVRWFDLNGPWAGKPRTRLLYVANVVELVLVLAVRQHVVGA
jgi:DNA-binding NtrC family response regulator